MRAVVVGASSGLGRCIGLGLVKRGEQVAMLGRRLDRLQSAVAQSDPSATAIRCDVTDETSVHQAIEEAARHLGGIDALIYTPGYGPLARIEDTDAETWAKVFATNVTGASVVTAAVLPHLKSSGGRAVYLSSVSGSHTPPWPGLGAYVVSKAALERLIEVWRGEHPELGFTRLVVGECAGGEGEGITEFANAWDPDLAAEMAPVWVSRNYMTGHLLDVEELVEVVHAVLRSGPTCNIPTVAVTPRPPA